MTHHVHYFYFGIRPSPNRYRHLQKLHPLGLQKDWADKLQSKNFMSMAPQSTHEHFMQVRLGADFIEPAECDCTVVCHFVSMSGAVSNAHYKRC